MKNSVVLKTVSRTLRRSSISNDIGVRNTLQTVPRRNSIASEIEAKKTVALAPRKGSLPLTGNTTLCSPVISNQPPKRRFSVAAACNVAKEMGEMISPSSILPRMQEVSQSYRIMDAARISELIDRVPIFRAKRLENTFNLVWERLEAKYGENAMKFPEEIVWLGGAPGSGKGTQSKFVASCIDIKAEPIVMSSLLDSPAARKIKSQGGMVNDEMALEALLEELRKPQYRRGAVVDGFPRTEQQVKFVKLLYSKLRETRPPKFRVVVLHVNEAESIHRQLKRGQNIKAQNKLRRQKGLPLLEERDTDCSKEYAAKRYKIFMEQLSSTLALKKDFPFTFIDATGSIEQVQQTIQEEMVPSYQPLMKLLKEVNRVRDEARKPMMAH